LIVGSGPSGVQAASEATSRGLKVGLVDIGYSDDRYTNLIPRQPFSSIRLDDPNQREYFVGAADEALRNLQRAGAHLTPPRQYMLRNMDDLFPISSDTFLPLQATSAGGLGVSWGANVFTMETDELRKIGLPPGEMRKYYDRVANEIGVSGCRDDDLAPRIADFSPLQPPLQLDSNAQALMRNYTKSRVKLNRRGFVMGQSVLAVLTKALGDRSPNPYADMDFYSDTGRSVYRPQFTLESLKRLKNFTHLDGHLAESFEDVPDYGVRLRGRNVHSSSNWDITARRLILAAGAINSGRLALNSFRDQKARLPILCNPNIWIAALNLSMLGRPACDARHSLAQLTALMRAANDECVVAQFYSYRSLLHYRLLPALPLPPRLGVLFLRLIETAFTCVNVHFADSPSPSKWIELSGDGDKPSLSAHYEVPPEQAAELRRDECTTFRSLLRLRSVPLAISRPAHGASVHYAGTLPFSERDDPFTCDEDGRLHGTKNVYVGDGSSWKYLPAKGLTFTLMANARRVAKKAALSLCR
ncbi:MAG TPA: GMC oxidoreductase, partial [Candidatus Binataceae bacterium]|nr:GMC oxidoreductase [Candidatus Binataceae bacterium]